MPELWQRIKEAKEQRSMSAATLRKRAGIKSDGYISLLLHGDIKNPRDSTLHALADALDVTVEQLKGLVPFSWEPHAEAVMEIPNTVRRHIIRRHTLYGLHEKEFPATAKAAAWEYFKAQSKLTYERVEFIIEYTRVI